MSSPKQQIYTIQEAARLLGEGSNRLFKKLRDLNILDAGNVPYQRHIDAKYFVVERSHYRHPEKGDIATARTKVTLRGLDFIARKLESLAPQKPTTEAEQHGVL